MQKWRRVSRFFEKGSMGRDAASAVFGLAASRFLLTRLGRLHPAAVILMSPPLAPLRGRALGILRGRALKMLMAALSRHIKVLAAATVLLATPALAQDAPEKTLMVFGDSLVAGYGIPYDQSFPAQLEKKLRAEGHNIRVVNAGVSGDTTSGGLTRLDFALSQNPDYFILELGANDMLRQVDRKVTAGNLDKIAAKVAEKKIPMLVAGMRAYHNLNAVGGGGFEKIYEDLADKYDAVYYPFFLEGVALESRYNLDDGLHPNPAGVAVIVDSIYPDVEDLIEKD